MTLTKNYFSVFKIKISTDPLILTTIAFIALIFSLFVCVNLEGLTLAQVGPTNVQDTFSGKGLIYSTISGSNNSNTTGNNTATAAGNHTTTTNPLLYRLTGLWSLNVTYGNVTNFSVVFSKTPANKSSNSSNSNNHPPEYEITNFHSDTDKHMGLNLEGTAFIPGTTDVKLNGTDKWKHLNAVIIIDRLYTLKLVVDSNATDNIFNQPMVGTTSSMIDSNGRQMIAPLSNVPGGTSSSSPFISPALPSPSQSAPLLPGQTTPPLPQQPVPPQLPPPSSSSLPSPSPSQSSPIPPPSPINPNQINPNLPRLPSTSQQVPPGTYLPPSSSSSNTLPPGTYLPPPPK